MQRVELSGETVSVAGVAGCGASDSGAGGGAEVAERRNRVLRRENCCVVASESARAGKSQGLARKR